MAIYISIMTLVFSCVGLGYGLLLFGWGPKNDLSGVFISSRTIIIAGIVAATINGLASNVLSDQLVQKNKFKSPVLRIGIPLVVLLITLAFSIFIALIGT
jgi:hypothetical protein